MATDEKRLIDFVTKTGLETTPRLMLTELVRALRMDDRVLVLDRVVEDTAVVNNSGSTAIYDFAVAHADINDHVLRLEIGGEYLNNTGVDRDIEFELSFGSGVVATLAHTLPASASVRLWRITLMVTSRNTDEQTISGASWFTDTASQPSPTVSYFYANAATENTHGSGTKAISITVAHSTASANLSITVKDGILTRL